MSCRACCVNNIFVPSDFNPVLTFTPTDKFLFVADCLPGSPCANIYFPGFGGGVFTGQLIPGTLSVCNVAQTAQAFVNGVLCATVTVPGGTYCQDVVLGIPNFANVVTQVQGVMNNQALAQAQTQANAAAAIACTFCNDQQTATAVCPGNPAITATGIVPANSICVSDSKAHANAVAGVFASNMANSILAAKGCTCYGLSDYGAGNTSTTCSLTYQLTSGGNLIPPPNQITVNQANFNWDGFYFSITGNHLHGAITFAEHTGNLPPFTIIYP